MLMSNSRRPTQPPSGCLLLILVSTALVTFQPVAAAAAGATPAVGRGTLVQVQVVTRHGARTPLSKQAKSLLEGGATLTSIGELDMYNLGSWLRNRYATVLDMEQYYSGDVHLQSSDFDRSIVSASSLALGLFPRQARDPIRSRGPSLLNSHITPANIPVHTVKRTNDIDIRSYSNCPILHDRLEELYSSIEFKSLQAENVDLLTKLAKRLSFSSIREGPIVPLRQLWNVYDAINVAKTECQLNETAASCIALPDPGVRDFLSEEEWQQTIKLAHKAEHMKFGRNTTKSLIGGNLLRTIASRMQSKPIGNKGSDRRQRRERLLSGNVDVDKFVLYSGHYPTILGLFASLDLFSINMDTAIADKMLNKESIPNYAAALIFELWENPNGDYEVVASYKDGEQQAGEPSPISLPCEGSAVVPGGSTRTPCSLSDFTGAIHSFAGDAYDTKSWCSACQNEISDVCASLAVASKQEECTQTISSTATITGVVSAFVGICLGAIMTSCCIVRAQRRGRYRAGGRREVAMGMRHGTKRADEMDRLSSESDNDEENLNDRI